MYQIKEVVVKNKDKTKEKKSLVIEFEEKKNQLLAAFLMTDAHLLNYDVLNVIDRVLAGEREEEVSSGNRSMLEIKRDETRITDLFIGIMNEDEILPDVVLPTKDLRDFIMMWKRKKEAMSKGKE